MYQPSSPIPPTPATIQGRFPRILLPDPPSPLPQDNKLLALLPLMQQGVLLTSMTQGIYGKRFCQAQVFWTGPHATSPGPHKLAQNTEPVLLFSKDVFKQREEALTAKPSARLQLLTGFFFPSCTTRTGPLPLQRRRAAPVWLHAVFWRRAEQHRRPVCEAHHSQGECSFHTFSEFGFTSSLFLAVSYHIALFSVYPKFRTIERNNQISYDSRKKYTYKKQLALRYP